MFFLSLLLCFGLPAFFFAPSLTTVKAWCTKKIAYFKSNTNPNLPTKHNAQTAEEHGFQEHVKSNSQTTDQYKQASNAINSGVIINLGKTILPIYCSTPLIPGDIRSIILDKIERKNQENKLEKNAGELVSSQFLLIPYTIGRISFISPYPHKYWTGPSHDVFIPCYKEYTQEARILPEIDMRVVGCLRTGFADIHVNIDTEGITQQHKTHMQFLIKDLGSKEKGALIKYDGFNAHNCAVITITNQEKHVMYILDKYKYDVHRDKEYSEKCKYKPQEIPLSLEGVGYLRSCMLYPNENKLLCAIANETSKTKKNYTLSFYEVSATQGFTHLVTSPVDHLFKKTVYLGPYYRGQESYIGLTEDGNVALIWLNKHKKSFEYFFITYLDKLMGGKKVERTFLDVAVDNTAQQNKIRHKIALLNNAYEVFICDLYAFYAPTLLLASEKPIPAKGDRPFRLLYDKSEYAIVWMDNNSHNMTRLTHFSDNFEQLYLKALFKYTA